MAACLLMPPAHLWAPRSVLVYQWWTGWCEERRFHSHLSRRQGKMRSLLLEYCEQLESQRAWLCSGPYTGQDRADGRPEGRREQCVHQSAWGCTLLPGSSRGEAGDTEADAVLQGPLDQCVTFFFFWHVIS